MNQSDELTGKQKRYLRALANKLNDKIIIGHGGLSKNCLINLNKALLSDELIKIRVQPASGMERRDAAVKLASASSSKCVQVFGNTVILYRENPENKQIKLP